MEHDDETDDMGRGPLTHRPGRGPRCGSPEPPDTTPGRERRGRGGSRTLALFDVENLLRRWPDGAIERDYEHAIARAAAVSQVTRRADVVIGVGNHNRTGLFAARHAWPTAALRCLGGRDGGELSLLRYAADLDAVARTYGRVVIGSGDGEFIDFAVELGRRDLHCVVVAWRHKLSRRLAEVASEVRLMDTRLVAGSPGVLAAVSAA